MLKKILIIIGIILIVFVGTKPGINDFMSFAPGIINQPYNKVKKDYAVAKEKDYLLWVVYSINKKGTSQISKEYYLGVLGNFYKLNHS